MSQATSVVSLRSSPKAETVAQRVQRLQSEINALGGQQVSDMRQTVLDGLQAAREVASNPAIPAGVRQIAQKVLRDGEALILTLDAIQARAS
jgi:hypothetical protein